MGITSIFIISLRASWTCSREKPRNLFASVLMMVAIALPSAAHCQSRSLFASWTIEPTTSIPKEQEYVGGEYILKQRLLPSGLVTIKQGFTDERLKASADAGTQFFEVTTDSAAVYCDARRREKKANSQTYLCFIDSDRDGMFEAAFKGWSATAGIPTITGKLPKSPVLIAPLAYSVVNPSVFSEHYFVGIQRRNYFNIYGRESFMIRFGTDRYSEEITVPAQFKASEMPREMTILGARFTAVSEISGRMLIKVHTNMPQQSFGVIRTVTYR